MQIHERIEPPLISDGTLLRALDKLLVLNGERLSYRALDVEQIGSVYETMMGFRLQRATGRSLAVKAAKRHGAPTPVDLDALLAVPPAQRGKWLAECADRKIPAGVATGVRGADSVEGLHAALQKVIDRAATPDLVPREALVLQPSEERRRSGSHYTPRSLTAPIVRTTLRPVLERLAEEGGGTPRPEAILDLKVCDPAIGSGAFLVETCRQLADELVDAWRVHGDRPELPVDEDEVVFARRLVAQRCLYGVDKNPVAVDLAKLSLWLVTLARDHAFTFLDHALRHGDSLVGLSRRQIEAFHWAPAAGEGFEAQRIRSHMERISELRREIREAGDDVSDAGLRLLWREAQDELNEVRLIGDLAVLAFFSGAKMSEREDSRTRLSMAVREGRAADYRGKVEEAREAEPPLVPFHWEVEFPEVFGGGRPGFDAMVSNPPFLSSTRLWSVLGPAYRDFLRQVHPGSDGRAVDLVAHFFRRCFSLTRIQAALGLIATNTIGQGDTRMAGLHRICVSGGSIYDVTKRLKWPGTAAVVVSVVHIVKGSSEVTAHLNGRPVPGINSYLVPGEQEIEVAALEANADLCFHGSKIYGEGFTFDDAPLKGLATPVSEMRRLISDDPGNRERIFAYIGGEELNTDPRHHNRRYVISFGRMTEREARQWPELMAIVEAKVLPERRAMGGYSLAEKRRNYWWQFETYADALHERLAETSRCISLSRVSAHLALAFQPVDRIFADSLVIFPLEDDAAFCGLQARPHELWAKFFGSSMKDDLRYSPSDCFDSFPFPYGWTTRQDLGTVGRSYYEFRAQVMVDNDEGLTKTYNRFHDPEETDERIAELRRLHSAMDRAVLSAYGWDDVDTACEFLLDHEDDDDDTGRRRKPWRYRWPDDVRDDVLARLIALNAERADEERRAGVTRTARPRAPREPRQTERLL